MFCFAQVQHRLNSSQDEVFSNSLNTRTDGTTATITNLTPGETYDVRILAFADNTSTTTGSEGPHATFTTSK